MKKIIGIFGIFGMLALATILTFSSTSSGNLNDIDLASLAMVKEVNAEEGCTASQNYDPYFTPNGVECPGGGSWPCCP